MPLSLIPITPERIDPDAAKVLRRLHRFGFEAYLVGGCVRDLLIGRKPKDFDVATSATPLDLKRIFRNCRIIGRRFRLAQIFFGAKIIETSTFRTNHRPDPPEEGEDLLIRRDNTFGSAEEDARRRDFTMNGLFYDIARQRVIDFVGGEEDIRAARVRTIGDPRIRFQEDPVRILRAIKFAARLGFSLDPLTEGAMVEFRGLLARCSLARILEEIYRLLGSGVAADSFRLLYRTGGLQVLFPELSAALEPPDNPLVRLPAMPVGARPAPHPPVAEEVLPRDPEPEPLPGDATPTETVPPEFLEAMNNLLARVLGDSPRHRELAASWLWAHLEALDAWLPEAKEPPTHALLLSLALIGIGARALDPDLSGGEAVELLEDLAGAVTARLNISRKDRERLIQILHAQRRLTHRGPRERPTALIQRSFFPEAIQLLELHSRATGLHGQVVSRWREMLERADVPSRRRRRRRPRHRRPPGEDRSR